MLVSFPYTPWAYRGAGIVTGVRLGNSHPVNAGSDPPPREMIACALATTSPLIGFLTGEPHRSTYPYPMTSPLLVGRLVPATTAKRPSTITEPA